MGRLARRNKAKEQIIAKMTEWIYTRPKDAEEKLWASLDDDFCAYAYDNVARPVRACFLSFTGEVKSAIYNYYYHGSLWVQCSSETGERTMFLSPGGETGENYYNRNTTIYLPLVWASRVSNPSDYDIEWIGIDYAEDQS